MILLLIFGLMYYLQGKTTAERGKQEIKEQRMTLQNAKPMEDYIVQCLNLWALRALALLGEQGGVIFSSQGGLTDDTSGAHQFKAIHEGKTYLYYGSGNPKVAYGSVRLTDKENLAQLNDIVAFKPPIYPYTKFPYRGNNIDTLGTFSMNTLNLLNASPGTISLQENAQAFITHKVIECVDFSQFERENIEIINYPQRANTTAIITSTQESSNVRFFLYYPIEIIQPQTGAKIKLENFTVEYPFKLYHFFNTINAVIDEDNKNMSFNLRNINTGVYEVGISENVFERDDVIRFTDNTSYILDKPYTFAVPRQNRPPALWLINQTRIDNLHVCAACFSDDPQVSGSTVSIENQNHEPDGSISNATLTIDNTDCDSSLAIDPYYEINLTAQDPDEDEVIFRVSGQGDVLSPTQMPITSTLWGGLPEVHVGERIHTIRIWADDGTPTSGAPISWQEYQDINLSVVLNPC